MNDETMKNDHPELPEDPTDELEPEYQFDYSKAKPNRFSSSVSTGGRLVSLDPDIAEVFKTAEEVNSVLRALITTMPGVHR